MAQKKKSSAKDEWVPVDDWTPAEESEPEVVYEDSPSMLEKFSNHWINQPLTDLPSRAASKIAEPMMEFGEEHSKDWYGKPALYGGAYLQSIGDVLSGFSSPTNIAATLATSGAAAAGRGALFGGVTTTGRAGARQLIPAMGKFTPKPEVARRLAGVARGLSYPAAVGGVGHMAGAESIPEFLSGGVEAVLGGLGTRYKAPGALPDSSFGAGLGKIDATTLGRIDPTRTPEPSYTPDPELPEGWLPFENVPRDRPPRVESPDLRQPELPFDDAYQPELPLGAYRGQGGRFTNTGPSLQRPERPFFDEPVNQSFDFGPVDNDALLPPTNRPPPPAGAASTEPQDARPIVPPPAPDPIVPPQGPESTNIEPPPPELRMPFSEEEGFSFREDQLNNQLVNEMRSNGYNLTERRNGYAIFTPTGDGPVIEPTRPPAPIPPGRIAQIQRERKITFEQARDLARQEADAAAGRDFEPQEMRIPGHQEGNTGLDNVAMGGADPRVLDVLGSSLYSRPRPVVTIKELLQNAFDEHRELGIVEPVKVIIDSGAKHPLDGSNGKAITVRDRGRGLAPEQIYTVLTDMGKTGKTGVESASGGFGFAKAAPFLGGKYTRIISVVDTPQGRMRYTFQGSPSELKNQARGVALNAEPVGAEVPTGLEVTTHYGDDIPSFWEASNWAKNITERSSSSPGGIKLVDGYDLDVDKAREWLDTNDELPYNYVDKMAKGFTPQPMPTKIDTINTPGANVNIHYDIEPGVETASASLHMSNKGMYQGSKEYNYGESTPNVPRSIVADIVATVEEGHPDYPFSANREQLNDDVNQAITQWVSENILTGVTKKRIQSVQRKYDAIGLLDVDGNTDIHYLDDGNKFTPEELNYIRKNPHFSKVLEILEDVQSKMMAVADSLSWSPQVYGSNFKTPSERLKKFGLLFQEADKKQGTTLGIHIPRPDDMDNSAILINLMEHLNIASMHASPIDQLTTSLFTTMTHEIAHIPGGSHDKGFAYRDADLRSKLGEMNTTELFQGLREVFDDGNGRISPEISEVLSIYNQSRGRAASGDNAILATGIASQRPSNTPGGTNSGPSGTSAGQAKSPVVEKRSKARSILRELYNLPRGATTPLDLSAPARQGLPLIYRKEWWKSWKQQIAAWGSEDAFKKSVEDIRNRPLFRDTPVKRGNKIIIDKSWAKKAGLEVMDGTDNLSRREEATASNWVETGEMFGKNNAVQGAYKGTIGRGVRASNRAYMAFLNQLRADTFQSLMQDAFTAFEADVKAGKKEARNPYTDLPFAKEIADFVNTASGRGPMRLARPTVRIGEPNASRYGLKESNFESAAQILTDTLFSPRLMFSRMRMLNPATYMMASPFVRRQYLNAALSTATAWGVVSMLAQGAGAEVETDTNSSDFGKIRIGNTRLDPAAGFQQYLVTLSRLITGYRTPSTGGPSTELGAGFRAETRGDVLHRFGANKLHPVAKFAHDLLYASERTPFQVGDRTAQLFVPLIVQDVLELAQENPELLPLIGPIAIGMGSQTYDKGEPVSKFISAENDLTLQGGGF